MADPFLDDESSEQDSLPLEFYDVVLPTITYRLASGNRDLLVGTILYKATSMQRSEQAVSQVSGTKQLEVSIPVDHAIITRYLQNGVPPRVITLTAYRMQSRSGLVERVWDGKVVGISVSDDIAKLLVDSRLGNALLRTVPNVVCGKACGHVLYGNMCRAVEASFTVNATALAVDGRQVRVDMGAGHGSDWSQWGDLVHVASGERMMIELQADVGAPSTVAVLTLQTVINELKIGDAVQVIAGCAHDVVTCHTKFNNQVNYGGEPEFPTKDPFTPGNGGVLGALKD